MPRLTISLPKAMHNRLSLLSVQQNDSLSQIVNQLLQIGMQHLDADRTSTTNRLEQHCQQLIIQMNALVKNMSAEILKFNQEDFEQLREAAIGKYHELLS